MTGEQRWAATGVVVVLAALWGAAGGWAVSEPYRWEPRGDDMTGFFVFMIGVLILAFDAAWVLAGLVTVRRVASGQWPWRPVASLAGVAAVLSALTAAATWSVEDELLTALFGFQAVALVGYAALLWTSPRPVAACGREADA